MRGNRYLIFAAILILAATLLLVPMLQQAKAQGEAGADGAGVGTASSKTIEVEQSKFLKMSKLDIKLLRKANERADTTVVIKGFPGWITRSLLDAAFIDRIAVKRLIRRLSGVTNLKTRRKLIQFAVTKAKAKEKLLNKDVSRARQRVIAEEDKIRKKKLISRNRPIPASAHTEYLKALDKAAAAARRRHLEAKKVTEFFEDWLKHPAVGK